ncbi:BON domain-containing protein [Azohydromonas aeria]|uniref:BON domain-containing protein n=1 Tax=Azohydromonas aeria TaxID=2590212 RepID=UPI0012F9A4C1|nr:BON domain-containing protein [Azohydromonas aeria]
MKNSLKTLASLLALGAALGCGAARAAATDDGQLAQQVQQALDTARLRHADVQAMVVDGKVRLRGWVDAPNDVLQAMRLTAAVPGVERVTSELRTWRSSERYY